MMRSLLAVMMMMLLESVVAVAALAVNSYYSSSSHPRRRRRRSPTGPVVSSLSLSPRLVATPPSLLQLALKPGEKCKYGNKKHWDVMYETGHDDGRPSDSYSWYCGWSELEPFWSDIVGLPPINNQQQQQPRILIAGIGNDPTPVAMYDAGYKDMTAFDYSLSGIRRAEALFGPDRLCEDDRGYVRLLHADFTKLPLEDGTIDATLDKGTLDAVHITGPDVFDRAVQELARVTKTGGVVVCVSNVITQEEWLEAFCGGTPSSLWEVIHDGNLAFSSDGAATINLGASLYSFRRTSAK